MISHNMKNVSKVIAFKEIDIYKNLQQQ